MKSPKISIHPRVAPSLPPPVLVVDDDLAEGAATRRMLEASGYSTAFESTGDAVLRRVRSEVIRLVVSEIYIPCSEGSCVVTALKVERDRLPRLRVLVHTRHTGPDDDAWALAAGGDGVLHKPASAQSLVREVERLTGVSGDHPLVGAAR